MLDQTEIQNLIAIVGTHPTQGGISSQEGQVKIALINKLQGMLATELKPVEDKTTT